MIKMVGDISGKQDGFRSFVMLDRAYNIKTPASLLQSFVEVVAPKGIDKEEDIPGEILRWEEKVVGLGCQYH